MNLKWFLPRPRILLLTFSLLVIISVSAFLLLNNVHVPRWWLTDPNGTRGVFFSDTDRGIDLIGYPFQYSFGGCARATIKDSNLNITSCLPVHYFHWPSFILDFVIWTGISYLFGSVIRWFNRARSAIH